MTEFKDKLEELKDRVEAQAGGNIWNVELETQIQQHENVGHGLKLDIVGGTTSGVAGLLRHLYREEDNGYWVSAVDRGDIDQPACIIVRQHPEER